MRNETEIQQELEQMEKLIKYANGRQMNMPEKEFELLGTLEALKDMHNIDPKLENMLNNVQMQAKCEALAWVLGADNDLY